MPKMYDIVVAKSTGEGKTMWRTIGKIFCSDDSRIAGKNGKPATFVIDFPDAHGIIVRTKEKKENAEQPENPAISDTDIGSEF